MDRAGRDLLRHALRWVAGMLGTVVVLGIGVALMFAVFRLTLFSIVGISMEPTLHDGDTLVLRGTSELARGDVAIFPKPASWGNQTTNAEGNLVKHVVAVPGDTLSFDAGIFRVNGEAIYDTGTTNYPCSKADRSFSQVLGPHQMFVMGDNAPHSLDSRRIFCDGNVDQSFIDPSTVVDHGTILFHF